MTNRAKANWLYVVACLSVLAILYTLNLMLFTVWQSSFTNANVPLLRARFFDLGLISLALLVAGVWAFMSARALKKKPEQLEMSHE
ncbi:MAG: hypothetical protein JNM76_13175 [Betaproteobacteria bacterium]|nr:hypothetical protein [Betaproteobacteria bacterium]